MRGLKRGKGSARLLSRSLRRGLPEASGRYPRWGGYESENTAVVASLARVIWERTDEVVSAVDGLDLL